MSMLLSKIVAEKMDDVVADTVSSFRVRANERFRVQTVPEGETRTVQSHKDLTDINNIVARYQRTGYIPPARIEPQYGDVSELNKPLVELSLQAEDVIARTDDFMSTYKPADSAPADPAPADPAPAEPPK